MVNFEQQSTQIKHLIAFGNPLLDHSFRLDSDFLLQKYNLHKNVQSELPKETIEAIISDGTELDREPELDAGGSALNTCKILRALGQDGLLFCGAIGDPAVDKNAETITQLINEARVTHCLDVKTEHATGICVCLIKDDKRSLHAHIGAAEHFSTALFETDDWKEKIEKFNTNDDVSLFYIEGYFIPGREEVIKYVLDTYLTRESHNLFITNLNAAYIVKTFSDVTKQMVEAADLIFGNREEYTALAEIYECESIQDVVQLLMKKEAEMDRLKIFVMTDGLDPIAIYYGTDADFHWKRHCVPVIPSEKVIDTTGAGDSFVAGFLFKFMNQGTLDECITYGCEISGKVIQNIGCSLR